METKHVPLLTTGTFVLTWRPTTDWPLSGTGRELLLFFIYCAPMYANTNMLELAWHSTVILFSLLCAHVRKFEYLCLFPKQIQMYVVVGFQFQCHGLYCLSLYGG